MNKKPTSEEAEKGQNEIKIVHRAKCEVSADEY